MLVRVTISLIYLAASTRHARKVDKTQMSTHGDGGGGHQFKDGAPPVTTVFADGDVPDHLADMSDDEAALASLGYQQEFKREFSVWTSFAVSFAVMGLLPSIATTMWYGIGYGEYSGWTYMWTTMADSTYVAGPAANTWGWLVSVVFILCVSHHNFQL